MIFSFKLLEKMTCQKLIGRLNIDISASFNQFFFNLSVTIVSDNDTVHVEYVPFYLPHWNIQAWTSPYIHHQIICTTENDKQTEISTGKTPGQKLRPQVVSSLILK